MCAGTAGTSRSLVNRSSWPRTLPPVTNPWKELVLLSWQPGRQHLTLRLVPSWHPKRYSRHLSKLTCVSGCILCGHGYKHMSAFFTIEHLELQLPCPASACPDCLLVRQLPISHSVPMQCLICVLPSARCGHLHSAAISGMSQSFTTC